MKQQDAKPEQALPHDLILEGRNKLTVTGVPVSYTHLDVYKRQVQRTSGTLHWW